MAEYTAKQVYELKLLPLKPRTLMAYALDDKIDSFKIGRTVMFDDEGIAKFKNECRRTRAPKPTRDPKYAGRN